MSAKILLRSMFIVWVIAVTAFSVISHPISSGLLMSVKLTSSGFVIHCVAYFAGMLLCCSVSDKKSILFCIKAGLLVFLYSVVLEIAQFYLPYRTFNVYDVVANGVGVMLFVAIWVIIALRPGTRLPSGRVGGC